MREVGFQLQIEDSLVALARKAIRMNIKIFQCFLTLKNTGRIIKFNKKDIQDFVKLRREYFDKIYLHSSYWVNLCGIRRTRHPLLEKELELAKKLEFTHIILHAGSARGVANRSDSIKALARSINWLLNNNNGLSVLLENIAHGKNAVGGSLKDFKALLKIIDQPNKLKFCIDTAHAYLFGYDIVSKEGQHKFIDLVQEIIGWENVELIHLNDTKEKLGSKIDEHCILGDGSIGDNALKRFILSPQAASIPIIMEVPNLPEQLQVQLLKKVNDWDRQSSKGSLC